MGFFDTSVAAKGTRPLPTIPRCGACGLYQTCKSPKMPPSGAGGRRILFVGEAPGEQEDAEGTQLIGKAGQCLRDMLATIDVDLDDCLKTNAVICRPPKNEIDDLYIESCRPNLTNTIRELQPSVIVLLGRSALQSLVGLEWEGEIRQMDQWVGWRIPSQKFNAWICPTWHPSYILRSGEDRALVRLATQHLRAACRREGKPVKGYTQDELLTKVEVIRSEAMARLRLEDLLRRGRKYGLLAAFDYETESLKPEIPERRIISAAFAEESGAFAFMLTPGLMGVLSDILKEQSIRKIAANMKFEDRWTRAKFGHPVAAWDYDTMLGMHVIDNRRGITNLKFQAYIMLGLGDYNSLIEPLLRAKDSNSLNRIHEIPANDLLRYNGLDALVEFMIAARQKSQLGID